MTAPVDQLQRTPCLPENVQGTSGDFSVYGATTRGNSLVVKVLLGGYGIQAPSVDPYSVFARAFSGDSDAENVAKELLFEGARKFFKNRHALSLERCCGLPPPTALRAWARLERNFWICRAGGLISAEFAWHRALKLAEEVAVFQSRFLPTWRNLDAPPPSASELRACLWHAHLADPKNFPESARQFANILQAGGITTQDEPQ